MICPISQRGYPPGWQRRPKTSSSFPAAGPWSRPCKLDLVHHLGEEVCHWLALRTLTINAHVLAQLLPGATIISDPRQRPTGTIWIMDMYPFSLADEASPDRLPHRWDVTSDSLALRVAIVAEAHRLVLLKSADGEPEASAGRQRLPRLRFGLTHCRLLFSRGLAKGAAGTACPHRQFANMGS